MFARHASDLHVNLTEIDAAVRAQGVQAVGDVPADGQFAAAVVLDKETATIFRALDPANAGPCLDIWCLDPLFGDDDVKTVSPGPAHILSLVSEGQFTARGDDGGRASRL